MKNKKQRKDLELALAKAITDVLKKNNATASKKIKKATESSAKNISKKFLKAIKDNATKTESKSNEKTKSKK